MIKAAILILLSGFSCLFKTNAQQPGDTAFIYVNATRAIADMKPVWAWFGYDEPNYTYIKDGKKLLSEPAALILLIYKWYCLKYNDIIFVISN